MALSNRELARRAGFPNTHPSNGRFFRRMDACAVQWEEYRLVRVTERDDREAERRRALDRELEKVTQTPTPVAPETEHVRVLVS